MVGIDKLVDIDEAADHGLVVLGLEDVVEADCAAEDIPCFLLDVPSTECCRTTYTLYRSRPSKALQNPRVGSRPYGQTA